MENCKYVGEPAFREACGLMHLIGETSKLGVFVADVERDELLYKGRRIALDAEKFPLVCSCSRVSFPRCVAGYLPEDAAKITRFMLIPSKEEGKWVKMCLMARSFKELDEVLLGKFCRRYNQPNNRVDLSVNLYKLILKIHKYEIGDCCMIIKEGDGGNWVATVYNKDTTIGYIIPNKSMYSWKKSLEYATGCPVREIRVLYHGDLRCSSAELLNDSAVVFCG